MKIKKKNLSKKKKERGLSNSKLFNLLLGVFRESPKKKFNYKQLSKILKIKDVRTKIQLGEVMEQMARSKVLEVVSRGAYRLVSETKKAVVVIKNTNKNGCFFDVDNKEVFIHKKNSMFALVGDRVEVLLYHKRKGEAEGEVLAVLERKRQDFVGVIEQSSSSYFLIPDDRRVQFDVFLPKNNIKKSFLNKKLLVKVESWDAKYKNPVGRVISVIGDINDSVSEINSILYDYGFSPGFPKDVCDSAEKINRVISKKEIKKRIDIRKTPTFTIDPEDAKDFDDALSVKKLVSGQWEVGVHIADVSHFIVAGGAIDKEAMERATSVYLVDRVVPMLPEVLSNDLCSLKPNVDRLAFSVLFNINKEGVVVEYNIAKTIIHSDYRFSYQTAQDTIDKKKGAFVDELILLKKLSALLRKKRMEKGSFNFEGSEVKFILDSNNNPLDVSFKKPLSTNYLIEEFMLLANKTVAKHIGFSKKKSLPFVYRVHDLPDNEKILSLNSIVKGLGYSINNKNPHSLSKSLNNIIKKLNGKNEQQMIETLIIQSMAKAIYTTKNIGHYGLGFDYYSHFTSPIRRYPDLITHRLLEKYLYTNKDAHINKLEEVCKHCSEMEKKASAAERDSVKYMQVKFLEKRVGETYTGVVSGVKEWGLYVEIIENKCEGLVKISSIKNDHYIYNEKTHSIVGFRTKIKYELGQKVKIKIKNSNLERRQLDFILV